MATPLVELVLKRGEQEVGRHRLVPGEYVLGRDSSCNIPLDDTEASRRHLRLTITEHDIWAEDLGSANGSRLAGAKIQGVAPVRLPASLRLGNTTVEINRAAVAQATQPFPWAKNVQTLFEMGVLSKRKYDVVQRILRGSTGVIDEVRDLNLRRPVAMKVLLPDRHESLEDLLRFVQAAQVAGQLEHPNIIPVHDLGVNDIGQVYMTMKLVKGEQFETVLRKIRECDLAVQVQYPFSRLLEIFQRMCDAVAYAHSQKVIHRNLKPEHILIGEFGEALITDWGLAKVLKTDTREELPWETPDGALDAGAAVRTMDGMIMGTPDFMSPEQAEGRISEVDERSDVFALGGILYQILTLQPPITGGSLPEMLTKVRRGEIPHPSSFNPTGNAKPLPHCPGGRIPEALSAAAMKALALRKEDRYQTVKELQAAVTAAQTSLLQPESKPCLLTMARQSPALVAGVALAFVVAGLVLGIALVKLAGR